MAAADPGSQGAPPPADAAYEALSVESATVVPRTSVWKRLAANWSVRIGGVLLAILVAIALAAPLLGTVDPALFDPGSRDLLPGANLPPTHDPYGQRSGPNPPWPVALRPAEDPSDDAPIWQGTLIGLGRDALSLALQQPSAPRQRLLIDLSLGERGHAQILVECRWQRRIAAQRWLLGALVLKVRRRALAEPDAPPQP